MITFGRLSDLIENAYKLEFYAAMQEAFDNEEVKTLIIYLNTVNQLFLKGIDAQGRLLSDIGGEYAPSTLDAKQGTRPKNLPYLIDLKDTGAFYQSFDVEFGKKAFTIVANTMKEGIDLRKRWGDYIVGLAPQSVEVLAIEVSPKVRDVILNTLLS